MAPLSSSCSRRSAEESAIARFLERSGPGLQQLAYRVDDVERAASVLRGKGLRLLYDAAKRGTDDSMINFVHPKDTGGVLIELVQAASGVERIERTVWRKRATTVWDSSRMPPVQRATSPPHCGL